MVNHRELLNLLLDESESFIGLYDPFTDGFIKVNKGGLAMFEVEDLNHFEKPIWQNWFPSGLQARLQAQNKWRKEMVLVTNNNRKFWGRLEISLLEQAPGFYLWVVRIVNIDQYKKAEQEAEGKEAKFRAVFEYAAIGILMVDEQGRIVMANRFIQTLFGFKPEELRGQQMEILLPERLRENHQKLREAYVRHPKVRPMGKGLELQGHRKDGGQFPVEVILSYFYEDQRQLAVAFIQDITFKVEATQQLLHQQAAFQELNANLETEVVSRTQALVETLQHLENSKIELERALIKEKELGELKSRFVAIASHEFRTPLSVIQSSADLIRRYTTPEEQKSREKHLQHIQSSVGYLTDILEEFLSVGKLEEGRIKANFAELNWLNLVKEVIADLDGSLKPGQQLNFRHTGETTILLDKSLIRKVLINLLSNAIKFSPPETKITITSQNLENGFSLVVKDQGIGISEKDMKHLTERFYRGSNALSTQGTGLGLHIVHKYVELLHGKMEIKSELGQSTMVQVFFFPLTDSVRPTETMAGQNAPPLVN